MKDKNITIASLLYRYSPKLLAFSVGLGAFSGALYALIIPLVLNGIGNSSSQVNEPASKGMGEVLLGAVSQNGAAVFFALVILIFLTKASSVILVNNIAKSAAAELKISVVKKINNMSLQNVENAGFSRLLNVLIDDVNQVVGAAVTIPMLVVSSVTVVGMLGYLASLNVYIFLVVLASIIVGVVIFQAPVSASQGLYEKSRKIKDDIQEGIRGLIFGAYELKLDKKKSDAYIEHEIVTPQNKSVRLEKFGDAILHLAGNSSDLLALSIIGCVVFVLPQYEIFPAAQNYGVVMALLYIAGPVASILSMLQQLKMGQVSITRIHQLAQYEEEVVDQNDVMSDAIRTVQTLRVKDLHYRYPGYEQDRDFSVGPITLSFSRGQISFIVGGNGSGKSTLSKMLSLHYRPSKGQVYFDNVAVNEKTISAARERISVIFSNYYLFSRLYHQHSGLDQEKINHYLDGLGLKGKTAYVDGRFTTTKLSDGQRRRLALLIALFEDRDIYIFDEWAADQDPLFKRLFYREILPDMKRNNKLVIVITHDDRYFECADRVIFMEDGKVIAVKDQSTMNMSQEDVSAI
ncbi:MAG: cyclic peptide transporter [Alteromonadaceae bacterium]|nr:MAG: cyclic peptide transporter [Alteromonadaceae bacterium]